MAAAVLLTALSMLVPLTDGLASTDTITWGGDNSRTGYQTNHNMDPAIVGSSEFAQIFKTQLPGDYNGAAEQVFSQPLVYTPSNGSQYVYFATTQNNVYKLDSKTGKILTSRNLAIPFLTADLNGCVDINPLIGVTSTGVIDPDTDTLYLMSKTYANQSGGTGAQGKPNGRYYLHALDVNDLTERPNFPVNLEGIVARNNPTRSFNGGIQHQRPGLLHSGQYIYAGFASHCVQYNFTGWLMGFDKTTGAVVERFATEGDGVPNTTPGGGVWMSGGGLASDDKGSLFFGTGNGYASQLSTIPVEGRNPPTALEEAAVHMTLNNDGSVTLVDFFMPQEKQALDGADKDLGTSPLELLPSEFSCGNVTRIGVITGKSGKTYILDLDDLGGYRTGADSGDRVLQVYQNENSVYAGAGVYPLEGGYIYINVIQYPTHVFKFSCNNGIPSFIKVADSPENNAYTLGVSHGTVTSLNGEPGTGLLWTTDVQGNNLRIYNAVPEDGYLTEIRNFSVPGTTKFTRAVFGDGRMYMGTTQGYVYGFGAPVTSPWNCTAPENFGSLDVNGVTGTLTINCTAVIGLTVNSLSLNNSNFAVTSAPKLPLPLSAGASFTFNASFKPTVVGFLTGSILLNTTNGATGYSTQTTVLLEGTGLSAGPLLSISPTELQFTNVVIGSTPGGVIEPVILSNDGNSSLDITNVQYSEANATGPWLSASNSTNGSQIGAFTLSGIPSTIAANNGATLDVAFNPSSGGNYTLFVAVASNGGNQTFTVTASAGPAPSCLVEFQSPDGLSWIPYEKNVNFTFGNVTENNSRTLKMRVTNNGSADAVPLSITVSKPPFGVPGIIDAVNQVDLAEGTILKAGESTTASLYCAVPKGQWNTDPYYGAANWTMNTNDPDWDKQYIQFSCLAVSEQAAPLQANGEGVYRYVGCFKENNPGRQLQKELYGDNNNTIAMCIAACAQGNYAYCGVQYQRECWAGPNIPVQQVGENNCNYACSGNINEVCGGNGATGGGAYISLFAREGASTNSSTTSPSGPSVNPGAFGYASIGCYHEPSAGRALSSQLSVASQTVDNCLAAAAAAHYQYAGLEYGGECWAGNALASGANLTTLSSCVMTCNGNGSEYCGGSLLLNLYEINGTAVLPSSSGTATSATSTTLVTSTSAVSTISTISTTSMTSTIPATTTSRTSSTTTASTAIPATHTTKPTVGNWVYQGCYTEGTSSRALAALSQTNNNMTYEECASFCSAYAYFGVEYGDQCYCGNYFSTGSTKTAETACSMNCAGDATELCGAGSRLNVYYQTGKPTGPPATRSRIGNFSYAGCYSEATTGRALSSRSTSNGANMTEEVCAAFCIGYTYFGVEYARECYCGNALGAGAVKLNETQCSMACVGAATELCGGSGRLNVFTFSPSTASPISSSSSSSSTVSSSPISSVTVSTATSPTSSPASPSPSSSSLTVTSSATDTPSASSGSSASTSVSLPSSSSPFPTSTSASATSSASMPTSSSERPMSIVSSTSSPASPTTSVSASPSAPSSASPTQSQSTSSASSNMSNSLPTSMSSSLIPSSSDTASSHSAPTITTVPPSTSVPTSAPSSSQPPSPATSSAAPSSATASSPSSNSTTSSLTRSPSSSLSSSSSALPAVSSLAVITPPGANCNQPLFALGNANFTVDSCYREPASGHLLSDFIAQNATSMTVDLCLSRCWQYAYAGLEDGSQCWCGNALNLTGNGLGGTAGDVVSLAQCTTACPGNRTQYCGGKDTLLVYKLTQVL